MEPEKKEKLLRLADSSLVYVINSINKLNADHSAEDSDTESMDLGFVLELETLRFRMASITIGNIVYLYGESINPNDELHPGSLKAQTS